MFTMGFLKTIATVRIPSRFLPQTALLNKKYIHAEPPRQNLNNRKVAAVSQTPFYPNITLLKNDPAYPKPKGLNPDEITIVNLSKKTRIFHQPFFTLRAKERNQVCSRKSSNIPGSQNPRVAIICSKKNVAKLAVIRNRARRRFRNAFTLLAPHYSGRGIDYSANLKSAILKAKWADICTQLKTVMIKANKTTKGSL